MRRSVAVLCCDHSSVEVLKATLEALDIDMISCRSRQQALELAVSGRCSNLIVDFDLAGAEEVVRMTSLLPESQRPLLLALASRVWPGTGRAFHSGVHRILYRPLDAHQLRDALKPGRRGVRPQRRCPRYEMKTLVYLESGRGTIPAISIDIGEAGIAVQAAEVVPITSRLAFRCTLPGTEIVLKGYAEVIWASDQGRAGMFFSDMSPAARKHLRQWLSRRAANSREKHAVRDLLPSEEGNVEFALTAAAE